MPSGACSRATPPTALLFGVAKEYLAQDYLDKRCNRALASATSGSGSDFSFMARNVR